VHMWSGVRVPNKSATDWDRSQRRKDLLDSMAHRHGWKRTHGLFNQPKASGFLTGEGRINPSPMDHTPRQAGRSEPTDFCLAKMKVWQ
jgi:hypothetical protein